jgi:hypothetical protein
MGSTYVEEKLVSHCSILTQKDIGSDAVRLLKNNYNAKLLTNIKQGLNKTNILVAELIGYGYKVLFNIQHSEALKTTSLTMFNVGETALKRKR